MENNLSLSEKFFLLCVRPDKGGLVGSGSFPVQYSLKACLIKELEIRGNIVIRDGRIEIKSFKSDDHLLEFVLSKFEKYDKPLKVSRWFTRLYYSVNHIKKEVKSSLVKKRFIRIEKKRFLFFSYGITRLVDKKSAREIADNVKSIIYKGEAGDDWIFLVSLVEPAGLLYRLFPERQSRKNARSRLKHVNFNNDITIALKRAINGTRAALAS